MSDPPAPAPRFAPGPPDDAVPLGDAPPPDDALPPGEQTAALRIVDANFNRAAEGLRVVEEYCRFVLADRHLTGLAKGIRHDLVLALAPLASATRLAARETLADPGTSLGDYRSVEQWSLELVATANLKRVEQALRAIEEYVKPLHREASPLVESLRYRTYTLAKAIGLAHDSRRRLVDSRLYVLLDGRSSECAFAELATKLIAAGVHIVQLRDKVLPDRELLARARLLRRIIDEHVAGQPSVRRPLFIMNDRPDLAVLARADGVHIGQEELTVREVREIVGPTLLVGVSTHSISQARQAVLDGTNYLGCGPTFPSGTKSFAHFPGLEFLRQVAEEISLPAFAIGGITASNLPQVLGAGFSRVAVSGGLISAADPAAAAEEFLTALGRVECVAGYVSPAS
jgi:thiamine-phosphate pyrophosphorylase